MKSISTHQRFSFWEKFNFAKSSGFNFMTHQYFGKSGELLYTDSFYIQFVCPSCKEYSMAKS